jgi:tripartite-type tricarboxylate transporter receptor subunit TctC
VLHPSVPANNLREFIALAKSKPGQLNFASSGSGSATQFAAELLGIMAGIKMQHIPYKGGSQVMTDLLGGQVQMLFATPLTALAHVKNGRLKAIAYSDTVRFPALPQVPTFAEAGLPGYSARTWHGMLAPASTPKTVVDRLSNEIARSLNMPGVKEKLAGQGLDLYITNPEQFAALLKSDMETFARIIKAANIKVDD